MDKAAFRTALALMLMDTTNARWSTTALDQALIQALATLSAHSPVPVSVDLTLAAGRIQAHAITDLFVITSIWYPYDSTTPQHPPNLVHWFAITSTHVYLDVDDAPAALAKARIFYLKRHTIDQLDSATATSLSSMQEQIVLALAAAHCCEQMSAATIGQISTTDWTPQHWHNEAQRRYTNAMALLGALLSQGQRGPSNQWPIDKWDTYQYPEYGKVSR